jgi:2-oxoglutarate ferredoxin oxidoreductase subunit beta
VISTNLNRDDYTGGKSTLCTGCGHDQITNHIITAFYESGIDPFNIVKVSGIGCSSKLPGYFLSKSQGINSMHGRMAPVATGAQLVNDKMTYIGISGDGDMASIGLGGFAHLVRRNLNIVYIVANNGVYGLTKGQLSPTADQGTRTKSGSENILQEIDLCSLAIDLNCSFVARAFSSNAKQVVNLLKAAIQHSGTALIDIISPCTTFNNHHGSTKSYEYVKEHGFILNDIVPGSHDIHDRIAAMKVIYEAKDRGEIPTGLFYINAERDHFAQTLNLPDVPLSKLTEADLRPSAADFQNILKNFI